MNPQYSAGTAVSAHRSQYRRWKRSTGWALIGDGVAGLIWPCEYLRKLEVGPRPWRNLLEVFAEHPQTTRALCVAEIAVGIWLAAR